MTFHNEALDEWKMGDDVTHIIHNFHMQNAIVVVPIQWGHAGRRLIHVSSYGLLPFLLFVIVLLVLSSSHIDLLVYMN